MTSPPDAVEAYVGVGSNVEPRENIPAALERLLRRVEVTGISTFYRTQALAPAGGGSPADQDDFVNGVFRLRVSCGARELKFDILRAIEDELGRRRSADRHAPRTIDLGVLLCGDEVIDEPDLKVPAADVERPFMAAGLLELAPELVLPHTRQCLSCLWGSGAVRGMAEDPEINRRLKEIWQR